METCIVCQELLERIVGLELELEASRQGAIQDARLVAVGRELVLAEHALRELMAAIRRTGESMGGAFHARIAAQLHAQDCFDRGHDVFVLRRENVLDLYVHVEDVATFIERWVPGAAISSMTHKGLHGVLADQIRRGEFRRGCLRGG